MAKMNLTIKYNDITKICYGICVFLFVIGQSSLLSVSSLLSTLCRGIQLIAAALPIFVVLKRSKFSIGNLLLWGLLAALIVCNIVFNQAESDLVYIVLFCLYCSNLEPTDVLKTYYISASLGIVLVIAAWGVGLLPSEVRNGRAYLGFYYTTFGPNLFLHAVLAYIASRAQKIRLLNWIVIEVINVWFYVMTDTLAAFVIVHAGVVLYYLFRMKKIQRFLFEKKFMRRLLQISPFLFAAATIAVQYLYMAHSSEPIFDTINSALSNRLYFGKIALERYGISLFGQPITWLTGTDGSQVSGMDYFYVDSSYLQVLLRYGVAMLVVLCLAMAVVQFYSAFTKNIYVCLGCTLFLVHCITDPQLLSFRYNPFIIASIACLSFMHKQKKNLQLQQKEEIL